MRWLKIIFTVLVVCVFLALLAPFAFVSGCIAVGDKLVELPPLRIEGKLIRPSGQAVAGETVGLGLSTEFYDHDAYAAVRGRREPLEHTEAWVARVETGDDGTFSHVFPKRSYNYAAAFLLGMPIGGDTSDELRLLIIPADGQGDVYWVRALGSDCLIRMVEEGVELPSGTTASAHRGETEDGIDLTIVALPTPQTPPE